jgi:hypothetical protein
VPEPMTIKFEIIKVKETQLAHSRREVRVTVLRTRIPTTPTTVGKVFKDEVEVVYNAYGRIHYAATLTVVRGPSLDYIEQSQLSQQIIQLMEGTPHDTSLAAGLPGLN